MTETTLTPDLCILGGGHGAAAIAAQAALLGLRTVLVRPDRNGTPPPSRQLHALAAAARAQAARVDAAATGEPFDFGRVRQSMQQTLAEFARNESGARLAALGVLVLPGDGRFVDPVTVAAGGTEIRARRFLVVPRFAPVVPTVRGLARAPHLTPDRLHELRELPRQLVVLGAAAGGLSIAQSFRRLGSEVTVIDQGAPLTGEDREAAQILLDALMQDGVRIFGDANITDVEGKRGALNVTVRRNAGERTFDATHLFAAGGWRPEFDELGLAAAEIDADAVAASGDLRTTNGRVFVAANGPDAPQADAWHARLILTNLLLRTPLRADRALIARATATDPALAHAGMNEDEARTRYRRIRVLRWPFAENEAAIIAGRRRGFVKLVTTRGGRLLGATIVGDGADAMIGVCAIAAARRSHLRELAGPVFPAGTAGQAIQQAALSGLGAGLTSPWMQRIIVGLRWFG